MQRKARIHCILLEAADAADEDYRGSPTDPARLIQNSAAIDLSNSRRVIRCDATMAGPSDAGCAIGPYGETSGSIW
jgi:hypothetical protein